MQNIGAAALFLPAVQRISKNLKIPIGKLLMPIGFSAILGGTVTLVGSSPLILLNDLMVPFKLKPFGLFDVTPVGLALVAAGIACFMFSSAASSCPAARARKLAPPRRSARRKTRSWTSWGRPWELITPEDFTHYREPVTVDDLRRRYLVNVVGLVEPPDFKVLGPAPDQEIRSGVDLVVYGQEKDVRRMAQEEGMELKDSLELFKGELAEHASGTVEAVVAPRSSLAGKTLNQVDLAERFQVAPLAVYRQGVVYRAELGDLALRVGDAILTARHLETPGAAARRG